MSSPFARPQHSPCSPPIPQRPLATVRDQPRGPWGLGAALAHPPGAFPALSAWPLLQAPSSPPQAKLGPGWETDRVLTNTDGPGCGTRPDGPGCGRPCLTPVWHAGQFFQAYLSFPLGPLASFPSQRTTFHSLIEAPKLGAWGASSHGATAWRGDREASACAGSMPPRARFRSRRLRHTLGHGRPAALSCPWNKPGPSATAAPRDTEARPVLSPGSSHDVWTQGRTTCGHG